MIETVLILFVLLEMKHFFADFPLQTQWMIDQKGTFFSSGSVAHAGIHGVLTFFVFLGVGIAFVVAGAPVWSVFITAVCLGMADLWFHAAIDSLKMTFGTKDITTPRFWQEFGLDQYAHHMTYVVLIILFLVLI